MLVWARRTGSLHRAVNPGFDFGELVQLQACNPSQADQQLAEQWDLHEDHGSIDASTPASLPASWPSRAFGGMSCTGSALSSPPTAFCCHARLP